ncbi:hypothetical protein N7499_005514 [Penicillium canescens]|uniref:Uncharacterized protein n=1 Tax=Penicillium canescens TaxID=5083 RepID=A0AAD6IBT3_PENCN|nr:uncharacterized protein N7446_001280 [Penicillium canescens]KAJ5998107.1 hypothetical protein N7522_009767 [Penicillium canescens]KAJ6043084.1 hypothetical protein N7460_004439 [Penicillium canescens]KAJ6054559.1 hypothetical protein N7444_003657 [Penicillium canescens]KAJ6073503.1 hypothetical protein N7446_001280 [Penicillium canescens]KAJ6080640.1 hypothetical protein N7499_005514 [Penicillium canescens]
MSYLGSKAVKGLAAGIGLSFGIYICTQGKEEAVDEASLAHRFASEYPPPAYSPTDDTPVPQLPAPILLPQRRPKNRKRGFVHAYAPDLADFGIDQPMFSDFLNTAEKACQGARWLNAINLASIGTMFMPSATGIAVSIAIQIATDVAIAVDGARRTNTFFDKMNQEFFQPRGLFCLVMTWNPELPDAPSTTLGLNSLIFKATDRGGSDMLSRLRHKFKSSDGKGFIFPEIAPLVFPELDQLASDEDAEKKLSKTKKKRSSHLTQGPKPTFTSCYADPNHPASSGDLLALVTGGHLSMGKLQSLKGARPGLGRTRGSYNQDPYASHNYSYSQNEPRSNPSTPHAPHGRPLGRGIIGDLRDARDSRSPRQRGPYGSSVYEAQSGEYRVFDRTARGDRGQNIGLLTPIAKLRQQKVLYLAIVNMPSEAEMAQAREALGA